MEKTKSRIFQTSRAMDCGRPTLRRTTAIVCHVMALALLVVVSGEANSLAQKPRVYEKHRRDKKKEDREISAKEGKNPLFRYFKGDYANSLLQRITKDTGEEVLADASIFALQTRRLKEASVFVVKRETGNDCGDRYSIFKRTKWKFTELLGLECVDGVYLTRKKTTTNGLPDLVYISKQQTGELYSSTFRFDGETYQEYECQIGKPDTSKPNRILYETVACNGRGVIRH